LTAFAALLVSYFGARFGALWVFIAIVMVERPKAPVETGWSNACSKENDRPFMRHSPDGS
jgi:hypothetical protein